MGRRKVSKKEQDACAQGLESLLSPAMLARALGKSKYIEALRRMTADDMRRLVLGIRIGMAYDLSAEKVRLVRAVSRTGWDVIAEAADGCGADVKLAGARRTRTLSSSQTSSRFWRRFLSSRRRITRTPCEPLQMADGKTDKRKCSLMISRDYPLTLTASPIYHVRREDRFLGMNVFITLWHQAWGPKGNALNFRARGRRIVLKK